MHTGPMNRALVAPLLAAVLFALVRVAQAGGHRAAARRADPANPQLAGNTITSLRSISQAAARRAGDPHSRGVRRLNHRRRNVAETAD